MGKKGTINKNDPNALKEAGNKAFSLSQFDEALELYTKAIEIDPNNHIFFANRANAYLETSNFDSCIEDCQSAIKLNENFGKAYYRKAKAQSFKGLIKESLKTLEEGIQRDQ